MPSYHAAAPHLVELGSWDGKTFSSFSEPPWSKEGESHLFEVRILPWKDVEIHQSFLIEEEKRALYAWRNGKPWMVLKKSLKAP